MSIKNNTTSLQTLLEAVNALPELPILIDEGSASELLSGKQLIDQEGNIITGTFSLDNELSTQDDLIAQIQTAVDNLPEAGNNDSNVNVKTCIVDIITNNRFSVIYSTLDESGQIITTWTNESNMEHSLTVIYGSYIFVPVVSTLPAYNIFGDAEFIKIMSGYSHHRTLVFKINGTSTIDCYDDD